MRRYETIAIVDPDLSEEKLAPLNDRITELIAQQNGFLILFDDWGIRHLAYEVKKKKRGHYIRLDYCGAGALVNELERFFRIDDRVMKYMTILTDTKADLERIRAEMEAEKAKTESPASETSATDEAAAEVETPEEAAEGEPVKGPAETAAGNQGGKRESATIAPDQTEIEGKE